MTATATATAFDFPEIDRNAVQAVMDRALARGGDAGDLVRSARGLLRELEEGVVPIRIARLLRRLAPMTRMVEQRAAVSRTARERILGALAYVAEHDDVIPDSTPEIGRLDDAIVVAAVARELRSEIDAFERRERAAIETAPHVLC